MSLSLINFNIPLTSLYTEYLQLSISIFECLKLTVWYLNYAFESFTVSGQYLECWWGP
jgi:hypothetical protein